MRISTLFSDSPITVRFSIKETEEAPEKLELFYDIGYAELWVSESPV